MSMRRRAYERPCCRRGRHRQRAGRGGLHRQHPGHRQGQWSAAASRGAARPRPRLAGRAARPGVHPDQDWHGVGPQRRRGRQRAGHNDRRRRGHPDQHQAPQVHGRSPAQQDHRDRDRRSELSLAQVHDLAAQALPGARQRPRKPCIRKQRFPMRHESIDLVDEARVHRRPSGAAV
jgi:hypothetical protein